MKRLFILLALIPVLILAACSDFGLKGDEFNPSAEDAANKVTVSAIVGVTPPAMGETPVTTITATDQYTGTVTWSDSPVTFAASTTYTATITLTAKSGYTLTGVAANFFTVTGATTDTNTAGSGVITADFPATAAAVINIATIPGVTAPVVGATPVSAITASDQYTGTVTWSPAVVSTFAASTTYTATITLTAKTGYTLTGVAANFFTVAGTSTAATNAANSGVITAVFPETGGGTAGITVSLPTAPSAADLVFQNSDTATITSFNVIRETPVMVTTTFSGTSYAWYIDNGTSSISTAASCTLDDDSYSLGLHTLLLVAQVGGKSYSGSIQFTVVTP